MNQRSAIQKINNNGILLVFPINNAKDPRSLWYEFFPRTKMRWEWDDSGDDKVANMWYLMKKLSNCRQVVYSKWYQGRATFFSRDLFTALLSLVQKTERQTEGLLPVARQILDVLESDSPLSTKQLKKFTELQGKLNEPFYNRGMKQLFNRMLIVAFGEVDDGAFPSLAVGSTKLIYEELWLAAEQLSAQQAQATIDQHLPVGSKLRKFFDSKIINSFL